MDRRGCECTAGSFWTTSQAGGRECRDCPPQLECDPKVHVSVVKYYLALSFLSLSNSLLIFPLFARLQNPVHRIQAKYSLYPVNSNGQLATSAELPTAILIPCPGEECKL